MQVRIANMGMQIALMMVFKHNFIHADLHPGNILVDYEPESKPDSVPSIVCLDAVRAYDRHTGRQAGRQGSRSFLPLPHTATGSGTYVCQLLVWYGMVWYGGCVW
jgi:hypothetical protein